jgi:Carboxypeptidase regulatory-like domain
MTLRALQNRWVIVPLTLAAVLVAWNLYVARNDGGLVEGRVVDVAGRPVPDATVILLERGFVTHNERQRTTTDAAGRFHFGGNDNHSLQLEAESAALGRSERRVVRLWFRAQNVRLSEPLRFAGRLP